jgi:hypothetical protein
MQPWPLWLGAGLVVMSLILCATVYLATWWGRAELSDARAALMQERVNLKKIRAQTGSLQIQTTENGLFVLLPAGTDLKTTYQCGGELVCLKLPKVD